MIICTAALALGACSDFNDVIAGTNPAIAHAVCEGDAGCESDMRELSHKLLDSDDANGDGVIDQDELAVARDRMDQEAEEKEAAASSSAAAASSSAAEASRAEKARAEREAEREAEARRSEQAEAERAEAERAQAERAQAERAQAEREAANRQQAPAPQPEPEPAPAPAPAPQQQAPAMEWATIGPFASEWTCEQSRSAWPVNSNPCYTGSDGSAYFEGMRQSAQ